MRITGLASGMNIDEIVEQMIKAESIPLNKMKQEKTLLEWKRDAYREMNTAILNFRNEISQMRYTSFYRTRTVTSSDESKITATAANGAGLGSYTISNVTQLATAASVINAGSIIADGRDKNINLSESLYSLSSKGVFANQNFDWKTGTVRKQTFTYRDDADFKLNMPAGAKIIDGDISVKVNGKNYEVVFVDGEDDHTSPEKGQVKVNIQTGQLIFNEGDLKENDAIVVNYVTDRAVQTRTIHADVKEIHLGVPIRKPESEDDVFTIRLKFSDDREEVELSVPHDSKDPSSIRILKNGEYVTVGTIDYDSGIIKFTDQFKEEFFPETGDGQDGENPAVEMSITYQQQYSTFEITAETSKGRVHDMFFFKIRIR